MVPDAKERLVTVNDMKVPFTRQYSGGVSYQLPFDLTVDADVVFSEGVDGIVARNDNVALVNGVYIEPDARVGVINAYHNDGWTRYKALQTQARYRRGTSNFVVSYTLAKSTSNYATGIKGGAATNALDLSEDEGPDDSDRRHNLVINGSYILPFGIQTSGIFAYRSGMPYSVSTSVQLDKDPFTDRPEPRNSRRGEALTNLDLRVSKLFATPKNTRVTVFWELFNVFNTTNFTTYQGSLQASNFGLPIEASASRRQQIGVRFDF